jgi:hypothetical protein
MSTEAGDIKYVWEKSRFTYIQTILRYDYHFQQDHADWVFSEMESWIRMNPINQGPNYRCSQEISLRVFNWLGALSFYRHSTFLTEARWNLFLRHMYWQIHHVRHNIQFSRIAVRNNHAITETLALFIFGTLFPELPEAREWKSKGKAWFEEEIAYQIYPDGAFLQFSMNYHRVAVQLLTLALRFSEKASDPFAPVVFERAFKTLQFLRFFQDPVSGWLPNYGANDGALFFQFTQDHFRCYNSQLSALESALLGTDTLTEEAQWFGKCLKPGVFEVPALPQALKAFGEGGFAGIREKNSLTFFRCGRHKDRPSQADNLHLDIWHEGKNLLRDAGSYKYNAEEADIRYFFGTRSHNSIQLNGADQMLKGPRFVWMYWSQAISLNVRETETQFEMRGEAAVFAHVRKGIRHKRSIFKTKGKPEWRILDEFSGLTPEDTLELLWHPGPDFESQFLLQVTDNTGKSILPQTETGWYSGLYGQKESAPFLVFKTTSHQLETNIFPI